MKIALATHENKEGLMLPIEAHLAFGRK